MRLCHCIQGVLSPSLQVSVKVMHQEFPFFFFFKATLKHCYLWPTSSKRYSKVYTLAFPGNITANLVRIESWGKKLPDLFWIPQQIGLMNNANVSFWGLSAHCQPWLPLLRSGVSEYDSKKTELLLLEIGLNTFFEVTLSLIQNIPPSGKVPSV